jgi:benzoyl-CoA reductase/2-hydroxyglutaryl-CoA dehydratase subunit BcrC/BadD/HgdB
MTLFDESYRSDIEIEVFRQVNARKAEGAKVFGVYCAFTPRELLAAAGGIPVALCAGSEQPMAEAERHLPRNLCPLIKSSYGHALADSCPYFHCADALVADATCDGKKKMFELLARIRPLHLLHLPQTAAGPAALDYWLAELKGVARFLEEAGGRPLTRTALGEQIERYNAFREHKRRIFELNQGPVPLVTGREIDVITAPTLFDFDLEARIAELDQARDRLLERARDPQFRAGMAARPRILLTGCPITNRKVLDLLEEAGAVVAVMENCGGMKTLGDPVATGGDPLRALAATYLAIPCPCMSPNRRRLELLESLVRSYRIDAVVELTWDACHTYNVEAWQVREHVQGACGRPYLQIHTDYSPSDCEQLRTRIGAFLEMLDPVPPAPCERRIP